MPLRLYGASQRSKMVTQQANVLNKPSSSPALHATPSADAGEASGDSTFLAGSGLDQSSHGDSAQGPGRGAEGSRDGGGVGNRVLMDTNKASACT